MVNYNEKIIQSFLIELLNSNKMSLDSDSIDEINRSINSNETGLALISLGKGIIDGNITLDEKGKVHFKEIMIYMEMNKPNDPDYWFWEEMSPHI